MKGGEKTLDTTKEELFWLKKTVNIIE